MRTIWYGIRASVTRMITLRTIVITLSSVILYVTLLPCAHQSGARIEDVVLNLVGGFEYDEIISLRMDELLIWTLLLMSYLRPVLMAMQEEYEGRYKDTLYRFSSYRAWYISKVLSSVIACFFITLLIAIGSILGAVIWGKTRVGATLSTIDDMVLPTGIHCLIALGLLLCSGFMLTQWQMLVHLLTGNQTFATIAFILPILISLYSCSNFYLNPVSIQYNPINWGIYMRSDWMFDPGFSIIVAVFGQLAIGIICSMLGIICIKEVNLDRSIH